MAVSLDKVKAEAPHLVSLVKAAQGIVLKKGLDPSQTKAAVVASFDDSFSAQALYLSGLIQKKADMVFAAGLVFDDDGTVPVSFFNNYTQDLGEITLANSLGFIERQRPSWGGTEYVSALKWVIEHAGYKLSDIPPLGGGGGGFLGFGKRSSSTLEVKRKAAYPTFAIIVTDGEPQDGPAAADLLIRMSQLPIFVMWIGVGDNNFRYLKNLNELDGRLIDNAGFFDSKDARNDSEMLSGLLNEFPSYVVEAKKIGLIA
jgi:hypothetical protein